MRLDRINKWDIGLYGARIWVNSRGQIVLRGQVLDSLGFENQYIMIVERDTGKKTVEMISDCCHRFCPINEHPVNPNCVLEACARCEVIRSYNINY